MRILRSLLRKIVRMGVAASDEHGITSAGNNKNISVKEYWTNHNVTMHKSFINIEDSLNYLEWRNSQYLFYDQLMPCTGKDGKVVLDFGCGPGNDVVGFIEKSNPSKVIAMDISEASLNEARERVALHRTGTELEFIVIDDEESVISLPDNSVDYINCSGVLHHTPEPLKYLKEFYRILKKNGEARIMVYNYDSIWVHLYVAYVRQLLNGIDKDKTLEEAFRSSTDGPNCPISRYNKKEDYISLGRDAGFDEVSFLGAAISLHEMSLMGKRYDAIQDIRLSQLHRNFLMRLTFDEYGRPLFEGEVAGIDAVFKLSKK